MFFDQRFNAVPNICVDSDFGVGPLCPEGRHHFIVAIRNSGDMRQLCQIKPMDQKRELLSSFAWFRSEKRAARVFLNHKKACQKCLRIMETILMEG